MATLLPLFRRTFNNQLDRSDAELLEAFANERDEAAFSELVRRHGPVVYRICRRLVGSEADDAFQATFLVLATRVEKARSAASVGGWLVGVAGRVARQLRRASGRRLRHEGHCATNASEYVWPDRTADLSDQFAVLDDELSRLPTQLRDPVVLCLLQGMTQEQAAVEIGRNARTLRRRLDRARQVLRARLERRGVIPAVAASLVTGSGGVTASVSPTLSNETVAMVFDFLTGGRTQIQSVPVVLANGVAKTMVVRKVMHLMAAVAVGLVGIGVVIAGDDPRSGKARGEDSRKEVSIVQSSPKPAVDVRQIMIQATCVEVPSGFCKDIGLRTEDEKPGEILAETLSPRESRMLLSHLRNAMTQKQDVAFLARPQLTVIEDQAGFVQVGTSVPYIAEDVEAKDKDGKGVINRKIAYQHVGVSLKVTPRINGAGKVLMRVEPTVTTMESTSIDIGNGSKVPAFNTQTVQSTVLASEGETAIVSNGHHKDGKRTYEVLWLLTPHIVRANAKGDEAATTGETLRPRSR